MGTHSRKMVSLSRVQDRYKDNTKLKLHFHILGIKMEKKKKKTIETGSHYVVLPVLELSM